MAVYNVGSINIDHVYSVPHFVHPGETLSSTHYQQLLGGKGANQSIALARAGVSTYHIGGLSTADSAFIKQIEESGVNCSLVKKYTDTASGHAIIQVNDEAENAIILFGGANQALSDSMITEAFSSIKSTDWVLFQNETNALETVIMAAVAKKAKIAFNPAPMNAIVTSLPLHHVDLLIVNEIEAAQLANKQLGQDNWNDIENALQQCCPKADIVITLGKQGAKFLSQGKKHLASAYKVNAVDTTAAGDTFIGYFLSAFTTGQNASDALELACAASALAVTKKGAAQSIPSLHDVLTFIKHTQETS